MSRGPQDVAREWLEADEAGDTARLDLLVRELTELAPDSFEAWFEAAMHSKARCEWPDAVDRNRRAMALYSDRQRAEFRGENAPAWNLGIAATALADWETARWAWAEYGIAAIEPGTEPIDQDFGLSPIRINPDRPSLRHQVVPAYGDTEVVWCWRRSPAHAVISSVPLPESGHRFRDVVLHDGEPKGQRSLDGQEMPVFDELARLEDSGLPTWQAQTTGAAAVDLQALGDLAGPAGLGVDNWSGVKVMCSDCSHGSPGQHDHAPAAADAAMLGLAGPEAELRACLDNWLADRPHLTLSDLTYLW
jgi:hypothetical protein